MGKFAFHPYPRDDDDDFYKGQHADLAKHNIWLVANYHEPKVGEKHEFIKPDTGEKAIGTVKHYHPEEPIEFEDHTGKRYKMKAFHQ